MVSGVSAREYEDDTETRNAAAAVADDDDGCHNIHASNSNISSLNLSQALLPITHTLTL